MRSVRRVDRKPAAVADALARLCACPDRYRDALAEDARRLVDDLLGQDSLSESEIRAGLDRLHEALLRSGHRYGIFGQGQRALDPVPIGSVGPNRSEVLFLCPDRRCSRFFLPADHPGEPVPRCSVFGKPLRERRL
jgi:hypothetical protein